MSDYYYTNGFCQTPCQDFQPAQQSNSIIPAGNGNISPNNGIAQVQPINTGMQTGYGTTYYPQAVQSSVCVGNVSYVPNAYYDRSTPPALSPAKEILLSNMIRHNMESETIDHKANRKDANDILKSDLKRQEMHEKAELDEKAMEKKTEIDKEKIILKEDLRLKKEHDVIVVVKNPERENRLCLQYQNASGKTIVGKAICEAKNLCMHRVESYADNDTHIAYRFVIDGKASFYIIEDELTPEVIAKRVKENGYPISFKRNKKAETLTSVFNCLKQECDNYPAEVIPYSEGWNHYTRNGNEHFEFVVPGSQLVFKQLAEGGDLK